MLVLLSRRGRIERACLLHPCSHLRPSKALVENMDAKRHARLIDQPCASFAGHVRSTKVWTVSDERASPRGYAFFVPLGGGESRFRITPTFTGRGYYSKTAAFVHNGFRHQGTSCAKRRIALALGVGHSVPKRKFRTAFANTVRNCG